MKNNSENKSSHSAQLTGQKKAAMRETVFLQPVPQVYFHGNEEQTKINNTILLRRFLQYTYGRGT